MSAARSSRWCGVGAALAAVSLILVLDARAERQDELDSLLEDPSSGEPRPDETTPSGKTEIPSPGQGVEEAAASPSGEAEKRSTSSTAPGKRRIIEEIIVTAEKTPRTARDVPISMTVLDDEFLLEQNITDFRTLTLYVPNARIDNPGGSLSRFGIRGFSTSALNRAFEQPVGIVLDGVPYATGAYFLLPLFDVERVEVLRGPQGTLFGKNTTAGLFNLATKKPTEELTGFVDVQLGEREHQRLEAAVGGPLVPGFVNFRLAGLTDDRDGFVRNTTAAVDPKAPERMGSHERNVMRVKLGFPDLLGANLVVGYERADTFFRGPAELGIVTDRVIPFYRSWDPDFDFESGNFVGSFDADGFTSIVADTLTAELDYGIGEWNVHGVVGHSVLDYDTLNDGDAGPAPMIELEIEDDNPQTTFELNVSSPTLRGLFGLQELLSVPLGTTELTAGFFYQRRGIDDGRLRLLLDPVVVAEFSAFQNSPDAVGGIGPGVIDALPSLDQAEGDEITDLFFDQKVNAFAGFGQMDWHVTDRWTLQYGMRLSSEEKNAEWEAVTTQGTGAVTLVGLGREEFTQELSRSELQFTPKVKLKVDVTDDVNAYAGWVRGFRGGGFNSFASTGEPELLTFEDEQVTSWELGSKMDLLEAARLNLGLFWMTLTDFQVLTQDPDQSTFRVENAGKARARGVELDLTYWPTSWLTMVGVLGFNDSEFLEFPLGTCAADRQNTDGDDDERCDHSGEPLTLSPKWTSTLTTNVRLPLSSIPKVQPRVPPFLAGIELTGGLSVEYQDVHFVDEVRDPRVRQPSFFRFNGHVGFGNVGQGWSLRLVAQNFTDEFTVARRSDVSLAAGSFWQIPEPPRLVFGELRWSF